MTDPDLFRCQQGGNIGKRLSVPREPTPPHYRRLRQPHFPISETVKHLDNLLKLSIPAEETLRQNPAAAYGRLGHW